MVSGFRVTVLISGRGSNLRALVQGQGKYQVSSVLSNNRDALGLAFAHENGIETRVIERPEYPTVASFKAGVLEAVSQTKPDLIALAGFMMVLQPDFIAAFPGRIVNIHPSLLPKFPGLHTHERALEAKEEEHGCSVHFLDAGIDTGPLIAQAHVTVRPDDTPTILEQRVLTKEHIIYPWVVGAIAKNSISLVNGAVVCSPDTRDEARQLGFTIFG